MRHVGRHELKFGQNGRSLIPPIGTVLTRRTVPPSVLASTEQYTLSRNVTRFAQTA
jgi:hypothetical protein